MPSLWKTHKIGQARVRAQSDAQGRTPSASAASASSQRSERASPGLQPPAEGEPSSSSPGEGSTTIERSFWRRSDRRHARGESGKATTEPAAITAEGQAVDGIEEWRRLRSVSEGTKDGGSEGQGSPSVAESSPTITSPPVQLKRDSLAASTYSSSSSAADSRARFSAVAFGRQPKSRKVTVDEAMEESIGEFGSGQQLLFALAQFPRVPVVCLIVVMVFTNIDPVTLRHFACASGQWHDACDDLLDEDVTPRELYPSFCALPADATSWTSPQLSVVAEFGLTCDERWLQFLANSAFLTALAVGGFLFDGMSHRLGRKACMITTCLLAGVSGVGTGAAPNFSFYLIFRTLSGFGCAGATAGAFLLSLEYTGSSWQTFLNITSHATWSLGLLITALAAFVMPNWRYLYFLFGGLVLLCILWVPLLPESPRWLLATSRREQGLDVLQKITISNETEMPKASIQASKPKAEAADKEEVETLWTVLSSRFHCLRLLRQCFACSAIAAMYYGSIWATPNLSGNIYLNNALMATFEVPAFFGATKFLTLYRKKNTVAAIFIAGGSFSLATALPFPQAVQILLAILAKMGAAAGSSILCVYTTELFPISVRKTCVALCSVSAAYGVILVPLLLYAGQHTLYPLLSYAVMGASVLLSGALFFYQPETEDQPQFQTVAEERFIETHLYHPTISKDPESFDGPRMETAHSRGGVLITSIHGPLHLSNMSIA